VGSGFCIRPEGVVVTCEHVFKTFLDPNYYRQILRIIGQDRGDVVAGKAVVPFVMFYSGVHGSEIHMDAVSTDSGVAMKDFDLAVLKLHRHPAFPGGYPTVAVADYGEVHEMMEIATCGYPLGESLHDQIGTVTSSFTRGTVSSIIPAPGIDRKHLKGFQLDVTATNGNSGGPVFIPSTGRVTFVLQGGVVHPSDGTPVQGLTRAEPIYPLFDTELVERLTKNLPVRPQK
jgi:S1-C subfamily serine protease